MIDKELKEKLLEEIEKIGNVWAACLKSNIHRATYYRWKKSDKQFAKLAREAEKMGRENLCDIAESALSQNLKEKKMDAIKYVLSNNSPRYKRKQPTTVVMLHKKDYPILQVPPKSLEDLIAEDEENLNADPPPSRGTEIILKKSEDGTEIAELLNTETDEKKIIHPKSNPGPEHPT